MTSQYTTSALIREDTAYARYGVTRQGEIWIIPDDTPKLIVEAISEMCDDRGMDFVFVSDLEEK